MSKKITEKDFPYKCNSTIVEAFENDRKLSMASEVLIAGLLKVTKNEIQDGWAVVDKEIPGLKELHTQLASTGRCFIYDSLSNTLCIRNKKIPE